MTDLRTETFDTPAPITVRVDQAAGTLDVRAEPTATTTVELRRERGSEQVLERTRVELRGDELVIDVPNRLFRNAHLAISVVVPEGSGVIAELAATDLICRGTLGTLRTTTASGDVQADRRRCAACPATSPCAARRATSRPTPPAETSRSARPARRSGHAPPPATSPSA